MAIIVQCTGTTEAWLIRTLPLALNKEIKTQHRTKVGNKQSIMLAANEGFHNPEACRLKQQGLLGKYYILNKLDQKVHSTHMLQGLDI